MNTTFFLGSVIVLALLLFFPVSRLMWVLSVRRLERHLGRALTDRQRDGQLSRARFLAVLVVLIFSFLFNYHLLEGVSHRSLIS
uniref:Uncharacterized protein n=1 Tax=Candidatus Kentrum sp. FM TaxID=2126340 RepID=A0A450WD27_9GAMM|nr:MAG: hypothetical protein BECKFM1743A_GA0114220_103421 [Candidatus Kentron sp. FM]VFJ64440.1 MAG: hypothetical protein BECKFM1743C_GA0114222_103691 [Candidatus Kentron sp. FM]VFK14927.1 MAG: hypothetical protein BECKFM1743B_GA0114221_103462 [Candidatus Kentron sp. FM]